MTKYIVIDSGSHASRLMFADVKNMPDALETSSLYIIPDRMLSSLCKFHNSGKINRKIKLPFRYIWDRFCILEQAKIDTENEYIIVMTNVSVKKFRVEYLKGLESYKNIHLVLIAVDSFVDKFLSPLDVMGRVSFDLIYSFDQKDCDEYGLIYSQSQYSKIDKLSRSELGYDIFFVGRAKQRYEMLKDIARKANMYGVKCGFYLLGVPKKDQEDIPGIIYIDKVLPYSDVLPLILSSHCLLDVVQTGQVGYTMRVYESVFYNKRLITNNSAVEDFAYYQKDYMNIFSKIEDINFGIFADKSEVDYKYKGEYSPVNLLLDAKKRILGDI